MWQEVGNCLQKLPQDSNAPQRVSCTLSEEASADADMPHVCGGQYAMASPKYETVQATVYMELIGLAR